MDDWDFSAEELDSLERDAINQIAQRNASSSSATTSSYTAITYPSSNSFTVPLAERSPAKPFSDSRPNTKVWYYISFTIYTYIFIYMCVCILCLLFELEFASLFVTSIRYTYYLVF